MITETYRWPAGAQFPHICAMRGRHTLGASLDFFAGPAFRFQVGSRRWLMKNTRKLRQDHRSVSRVDYYRRRCWRNGARP